MVNKDKMVRDFRAVVVTPMGISTALALAVAGGVRQRAVPVTLGTAA